ncbi:MAG: molybdenum cofactor biosynthesis protein B [Sandaracinus sp.]|nr:molybdenum cofactor biosynthesis protein B [Sandaracinus sp.]MCB9615201.1 molybdenum cofactor biosynthesis protein B [Sandaracinus sp.]
MTIDPTKEFRPLRLALLTVSDTRTLAEDVSGDILEARIREAGHELIARELLRDDAKQIEAKLRSWIDEPTVEVVIVTGGTGLTGRDVTPEAMKAVWEKEIPGFGELFRWISFSKIGTSTIQSRACAGVAKGTYLFAVPGSRNAVKDAWDEILVLQLDNRHRPCNFAELIPRLQER